MHNKQIIGLIFGGQSPEHKISLLSAKNIIHSIDKNKFELTLIGIDQNGAWGLYDETNTFLNPENPETICLAEKIAELIIKPGKNGGIINLTNQRILELDLVFPMIHGLNCEDGTLQGLLQTANLPFVGTGILGSAIGMDKDVMKRLLKEASFKIAHDLIFKVFEKDQINFQKVTDQLGLPLFIKPANTGSSIGISKVTDENEFYRAISKAFEFDQKILIEEAIVGREIECAVMGNDQPETSLIAEIVPNHSFYSYEAKYLDSKGASINYPVEFEKNLLKKIRETAAKAYSTLEAQDFARIDMFLTSSNEIYINEINTLPGFTNGSMFPKLWEVSGLSQTELITKIINYAFKRYGL